MTSTTNCSCSLPASSSSQAATMAWQCASLEQAELAVGLGGGLLDAGQRADQVGVDERSRCR
jgi:hypothetical protein